MTSGPHEPISPDEYEFEDEYDHDDDYEVFLDDEGFDLDPSGGDDDEDYEPAGQESEDFDAGD